MTMRRRTGTAAGLTLGLLLVAAPAAGKGAEVDGYGDRFYLTNEWRGVVHESFAYGRDDDRMFVGNWDGRGGDTLAVRRGKTYHFKNSLSGGAADRVVSYGRSGDIVYMGDWDGDGVDTPVVRRGDEYHFKNSLSGGEADMVVTYGRDEDTVLIGDWDGDGRDTLGVRRGKVYHLKNSISGGDADSVVPYGRADDRVGVGDWDGDGHDTLGVRRGNQFHVRNTLSGGEADIVMTFGRSSDKAMVGDWDGDGSDTVGLRRVYEEPELSDRDAYDARMVEIINEVRAEAGAPPVDVVPELRPAALRHSQWMASQGVIEHADSATIRSDAEEVGCTAGGEHIVRTYQRGGADPDPQDAMDWYMNSPVHRAGILNPNNTHVAVGTVKAGDLVYNTQRFVRNCS